MTDRTTDAAATDTKRIVGLFAKSWDPGTVKTRLAKTLGEVRAAEIYFELLKVNLDRFSHSGDERVIGFSPTGDATSDRFGSLLETIGSGDHWSLTPQSEGGLGTRMGCFFEQQFAAHGDGSRIVLIGSDALRLMPQQMEQAFEQLKTHDVVFGPSTDGGYYLVGMSRQLTSIFDDVSWSTESVLQQSLANCESAGCSVAQLEPLTDIDHEADLLQEVDYFLGADESSLDPGLRRFLDNVQRILGKSPS